MHTRHSQSALRAPLNVILGTEANVRLLRELTLAGISIGAGELALRAKLGRTSVYPALEGLEETGVVEFVGVGKQRQARIRKSHPLAQPLVTLFRAEQSRVQNIVLMLRNLFEQVRPSPISAWVEGAVLTHEDHLDDSIHINVLSDPHTLPAIVDHVTSKLEPIEKSFDVHFEIHSITRSELASRPRQILETLREAILLIGVPPTSLLPNAAGARVKRNIYTHGDHDARARRLAAVVAAKLKWDPSLIRTVRRNLMERAKGSSPQERRELQEWMRIFSTMSSSRLQRFLIEPSELSTRLRQTLPGLDILTPSEREAALLSSDENEACAAVLAGRVTRSQVR